MFRLQQDILFCKLVYTYLQILYNRTFCFINTYEKSGHFVLLITYITSFKYEVLNNIRKIDKNIKISWLIKEKINKENINKLLKINANQICPKATKVTSKDIALANASGIGVRLWGVKDEEIMGKVYTLNTEGMTVDFPDKLNKLMNISSLK